MDAELPVWRIHYGMSRTVPVRAESLEAAVEKIRKRLPISLLGNLDEVKWVWEEGTVDG